MFGKIAAAILLLVASSCTASAAGLTWSQWITSLKAAATIKDHGMITMIRFRDDVCASDRLPIKKRIECGNRVNDIVLRFVEEKKTLLDTIRAAESFDPRERAKARVMNDTYNGMNAQTKRLTDSVLKDFNKQILTN